MLIVKNRISKSGKKVAGKDPILEMRRAPNSPEVLEKIQKKAYELYEKRGRQAGHDWDDWFEAERLVVSECSSKN